MTEGNDISIRIRAWMEGRMSEEERSAFEAERAKDPELDREVKLALLVRAGLAQESLEQKRQVLKEMLQADEQQETRVRPLNGGGTRKLWSYLAIAATVIIIAGLVWNFGLKPSSQLSAQDLFASYYEVPSAPEQMGSASSADSMLRLGHSAYNEKDFANAQSFYQLALDQGLEDSKAPWLYIGIAALENEDFAAARRNLAQAKAAQPERAEWYLALLELRADNAETAAELLERIAGTNQHFYQKEAKELLEEL